MDAIAQVQEIIYEDAVVLTQYERGSVYVAHPQRAGSGAPRRSAPIPDYTNAWIQPIGG